MMGSGSNASIIAVACIIIFIRSTFVQCFSKKALVAKNLGLRMSNDGYGPLFSLLYQGPVPFFVRLSQPDIYEAAVTKFMAEEVCDRRTAQINIDIFYKDPLGWENSRRELKLKLRAEEVAQRELKLKLRAEEVAQLELELKLRAEETVQVLFISHDDLKPTMKNVSRKLFDSWNERNFLLQEIVVPNIGEMEVEVKSLRNFEDIQPHSVCELVEGKSGFDGYAQIEGIVQTVNCVRSILRGDMIIPDFNNDNINVSAVVKYEPKYNPPAAFLLREVRKNLGFNFPINPDALIIRGLVWILLESKHSCTNKDILKFERKVQFLIDHKHEAWVLQGNPVPTHIVGVINTVGPFSATALTESTVVRLIRSGLSSELA